MTRRLVVAFLAVIVLTLLALVVPLGQVFASRERDRLLVDIERDAAVVGAAAEDALEHGTDPPVGGLLARYRDDPGGRVVIVDRDGRLVADSEGDPPGTSFANRPEIAAALQGDRAEGSRRSETAGDELFYVALPVSSGGTVHGAVRITYPSATLDRRVRDNWARLVLLSAVVLATGAVVAVLLARSVTRPVRQLTAASRRLAAGDLAARAPTGHGPAELDELATAFNEMAARLEDLVGAQRTFVADASHQLRTPLAALRLELENLEAVSPDELQPRIAALRSDMARLARLTDRLLALARAGRSPEARAVVDAAVVVAERVDGWAAAAAEVDVGLLAEGPATAPVTAVPGSLEQILDNLVANALAVAPAGSTVTVRAVPASGFTELHVVDAGPGLDEDARARAFERFWRAPDAPLGGTGLGLAIVRQLARANGGDADLRAAPGGGIDAVVAVPTARRDAGGGRGTA